MKVPESTGKWVEVIRSTDREDELVFQVPNGIWAGWMQDVCVKEDDLAACLRSLGWQVTTPATAGRPQ